MSFLFHWVIILISYHKEKVKKSKVIFLILIFLLSSFCCSAIEKDSTTATQRDTVLGVKSGVDIIAITGLGMTTGSSYDHWESLFSVGPALNYGLELPFTKSHKFALEVIGHYWVSEKKSDDEAYNNYIKYTNKYYGQWGISTVLKFYLGKVNTPFRFSLHFGWMLFSSNDKYNSMDIGCSFYYTIDDNYSVSISRRLLTGLPLLGGSNLDYTPNLLMLNFIYKVRV